MDKQSEKYKNDGRRIMEITVFGNIHEEPIYKPFRFEVGNTVAVNVDFVCSDTQRIVGKIIDRYSTTQGHNYYTVKLHKKWGEHTQFPFHEFRLDSLLSLDEVNEIPEYRQGDNKRFPHNYEVTFTEDGKPYLDLSTYMPCYHLGIDLKILQDGQHDGRLWPEKWHTECINRLIEEILADIKVKIQEFVAKNDPFDMHISRNEWKKNV